MSEKIDGGSVGVCPNHFVQLQPWRDMLLGLTARGEVYAASIEEDTRLGLRWTLVHPRPTP